MRLTIKVKNHCEDQRLFSNPKGDWVDLYTAETVHLESPYANVLTKNRTVRSVMFDNKLIPLGVSMKLPDGFEAIIAPRSSTFKKYGLMQTNSIGVIDNSYCSDEDEWKLPVIATREVTIPKGTRLCQFRIQPSMKATIWQKLKWLFTTSVHFIYVYSLSYETRGGFGSTGD